MSMLDRMLRAFAPIAGFFRRREMETRFDEETTFHIEMKTADNVARGMSPEAARRNALIAFGGQERYREDSRDEWRSRATEEIAQDLRFAVRMLRHSPGFTALTALVLAIGIGAATVIFSVADHVLLRQLPYREPHRLVVVRESVKEMADAYPVLAANASHFLEWKARCTLCEDIAAIRLRPLMMTGAGVPQEITAVRASPSLFPMLGIQPKLGRVFSDGEDAAGDRVVVIGHAFWQREFGGAADIIGRSVTLDGAPVVVIGVLPEDLVFPKGKELGTISSYPSEIAMFTPLSLTPRERTTPGEYDYSVIVRMRQDATLTQLQAQLQSIERAIMERTPFKMTLSAVVSPLHEQMTGSSRGPLLMLLVAVIAVLLIVCTNLANLLLGRNVARARESALRVALGAGRGRLVRQSLTESILLALLGGAIGLVLSYAGLGALLRMAPTDLPRLAEVRVDARVLAVGACASLLAGMLFGVLPALRFGDIAPGDALRGGGRSATQGRHSRRSRDVLIATQVGISSVLLVATGLLLTSLVRVLHVERGFTAEHVLAVDVTLPSNTYDATQRVGLHDEMIRRLGLLPGVSSVATATGVPLEGENQVDVLSRENDARPVLERPSASIRRVSGGYFQTLGMRLVRGRAFDDRDRGHQVVVLSARTALALWPGEEAVGKRVLPGSNDSVAEVVGVVDDVPTTRLEEQGSLVAYLPHFVNAPSRTTVLLRTSSEPEAVATSVRAMLGEVAPAAPVSRMRTLRDIVDAATAQRRFQLLVLGAFALAALLTASIGIYGTVSHSFASRSREIAIRIAMGARPPDIHRLALREGMAPVLGGLAAGLIAALIGGRMLAAFLFEATPRDPTTFAAVITALAAVGSLACLLPSVRAIARGTAGALRSE